MRGHLRASAAVLLAACAGHAVEPNTAARAAHHLEAAQRRVADPARGGPPLSDGAAPLPPFTGVSRGTAHYVGAELCAACHPSAAAVWANTAHARARDVLLVRQKAWDPECLRCHVTGLGHPGGWAGEAQPQLGYVGCEACHGPGSEHVNAPAAGYGDLPRDASACVVCHTHDNSPDYRWSVYWPQIRHGREAPAGTY